ncbi:carnitine/acyl carnitine carrier [Schizopora paradoxa]|uniref:Carnitine/acyl carnitine carrier n=1 Tax=Schizopora paradoxa TaxID=27342 RepID=A0A0H2RGL9_9AGAM|nr:carnitine/acyl carnitine carrier [Schizopora paradoxa]
MRTTRKPGDLRMRRLTLSEERTRSRLATTPLAEFIGGTSSGIAGLAVGYPFDTVKVRFQNPEIAGRYRSTFQAFGTILREERITGLYKGMLSPMVSYAPLNGLLFASYRFLMRCQLESEDDEPTIAQVALAGAGTGVMGSFITCPIEVLKIRQQSSLESQLSVRHLAREIWQKNGIQGFYRGITVSILRDIGYGAYFGTYEATCRLFSRRGTTPTYKEETRLIDHSSIVAEVDATVTHLPWYAPPIAGALAGVVSWIVTFPFDVIKTRIQSVDASSISRGQSVDSRHPFRSTLSTIMHSYHREGLGVFFRGLSPTLIRAIPVNAATFAVFEAVVHFLSK